MKNVIVSTTIHAVSEAIRRYDALEDWTLVVVGDLKTPKDYRLERGIYLSPEMQEKYDKALSEAIGWNCIQRRNFGLLWAHDLGGSVVAIVDDDVVPYEHWGRDLMVGKEVQVSYYDTDLPVFDPCGATNESRVWYRGYPWQLVPHRDYAHVERRVVPVDVQADFWDGDPDTDAICRMVYAPECRFEDSYFPMASNRISPFNAGNTFLKAPLLKDYFLFPHINRLDDIWACYYLQAKGARVVYGKSSAYHRRNHHDLVIDLKDELLGYEKNLNLVQSLTADPESIFNYLPERSAWAFELYRKHFQ